MGDLSVTLIDVGWGDSIFIEHNDDAGSAYYGLVDSNDSKEIQSTRIFIERLFKYRRQDLRKPLFDFVLLSHAHDDHGKGLEGTLRRFGTHRFWHSKSDRLGPSAPLLRFCERDDRVGQYDALNSGKHPDPLGDIRFEVLWPHWNRISQDENDNSVVLVMHYKDVSVVLTGDAEEDVWYDISDKIPEGTVFFKVPHHGSRNGSLNHNGLPTWLPDCPASARLGISCLYRKDYKHPHDAVLNTFSNGGYEFFRTDEHYHVTFTTNGIDEHSVKYSHT